MREHDLTRTPLRALFAGAFCLFAVFWFPAMALGQTFPDVVVHSGGTITPAAEITKLEDARIGFIDSTGSLQVLAAADVEFAGSARQYLQSRQQVAAGPVVKDGYVTLELQSEDSGILFYGLDAEAVNTALHAQTGTAAGQPICQLPCAVRVPAGAYTAFLGNERRQNRSVELLLAPRTTGSSELQVSQTPNRAARRAGIVIAVAGILVATVGADSLRRDGQFVEPEHPADDPVRFESPRSENADLAMVGFGTVTAFSGFVLSIVPTGQMIVRGNAVRR